MDAFFPNFGARRPWWDRQFQGRVSQRDAVLDTRRSTFPNHHVEGGLQPKQTALIARQSHAQRIRHENGIAKAGRMRSEIKPRTPR